MARSDFAFPFLIDPVSRQAATAPSYEAHVDQMIRQVLFTNPGERTNLPEFGCGLRRLLFSPNSPALRSTTEVLIRQSLGRWLRQHVEVQKVEVDASEDGSQVQIRLEYSLIETRTAKVLEVSFP
jgi:phage baseplate assembly protein W